MEGYVKPGAKWVISITCCPILGFLPPKHFTVPLGNHAAQLSVTKVRMSRTPVLISVGFRKFRHGLYGPEGKTFWRPLERLCFGDGGLPIHQHRLSSIETFPTPIDQRGFGLKRFLRKGQSDPATPAGSQHQCQPTVKLYITPSMDISSGKGVVRGRGVQQLAFA